MLNRFEGYRIEVTNDEGVMCTGSFCIDNLEQLTSYAPEFKGTPKFSSVFIQLTGYMKTPIGIRSLKQAKRWALIPGLYSMPRVQ